MKNLLLLCCVLLTYTSYSQYVNNFNYIEDVWFESVVKNNDGSYLVLGRPDDSFSSFGFGTVMRFDANFNQLGTTIDFTNEHADNCCTSLPRVAHFINNNDFVVYGSVNVDPLSNIYYSFAKYDNTGNTPLIDKRLINARCTNMIKGATENYATFQLLRPPGDDPNNGTADFSFSYDDTIGNQQVALLAYDDNLDENWHLMFNANTAATNGLFAKDLFESTNGDLILELFSFGTLELNGNSYGTVDTPNYFFIRIDPTTQSVIAPVIVQESQGFVRMKEDPFNHGDFYLLNYFDILKLDQNWNIVNEYTDFVVTDDIFFTQDDLVLAGVGSVTVNTPTGLYSHTVRYFDRNLLPKYTMRVFGNAIGPNNNFLYTQTKHQFIGYENGVLEAIQTYGTTYEPDPNYVPEIDGTSLPIFNGGYHTVRYDSNYTTLLDTEYQQAIAVPPAISVYNYVEPTDSSNLSSSTSHTSYLIFPIGFDFTQFPLNSLVPSSWYSIPSGWEEVISPRFRFDNEMNLMYFDLRSADNILGSINSPSATRIGMLRVYLTDEQYILSIDAVIQDNSISIYPNPTKDIISINTNYQIREVKMYTIHGREIICNYENGRLDMSHLSAGMYILKLTDEQHRTILHKVVKE